MYWLQQTQNCLEFNTIEFNTMTPNTLHKLENVGETGTKYTTSGITLFCLKSFNLNASGMKQRE